MAAGATRLPGMAGLQESSYLPLLHPCPLFLHNKEEESMEGKKTTMCSSG
jgi:hypothetical protein